MRQRQHARTSKKVNTRAEHACRRLRGFGHGHHQHDIEPGDCNDVHRMKRFQMALCKQWINTRMLTDNPDEIEAGAQGVAKPCATFADRPIPGDKQDKETHEQSRDRAGPTSAQASTAVRPGTASGRDLDSGPGMTGLQLAPEALPELQAEYLQRGERAVEPGCGLSGQAAKPGDRRFSAQEWTANPASAYTARMYLLNARTLLKLADEVQADEKTRQRIRFAVQQWVDAASAEQLPRVQPRSPEEGARHQGREHRPGPAAAVERHPAGPGCRRPTRACSRSAATWPPPKARWCSRTSCSS